MRYKQHVYDYVKKNMLNNFNHMIVVGIQEMNFSMIGQVSIYIFLQIWNVVHYVDPLNWITIIDI